MKTVITALVLLLLAACSHVPTADTQWESVDVDMKFSKVIQTLQPQLTRCFGSSGLLFGGGSRLIPSVNFEERTAEFYVEQDSGFSLMSIRVANIRVEAVDDETTNVKWADGGRRLRIMMNGWLNGSVKCNGK